jgi:hypothetical protein
VAVNVYVKASHTIGVLCDSLKIMTSARDLKMARFENNFSRVHL